MSGIHKISIQTCQGAKQKRIQACHGAILYKIQAWQAATQYQNKHVTEKNNNNTSLSRSNLILIQDFREEYNTNTSMSGSNTI